MTPPPTHLQAAPLDAPTLDATAELVANSLRRRAAQSPLARPSAPEPRS